MVTNLLQVLSEVEVLVEESIDERSAGFITQVAVRSAIYKQCTGGLVVRWVTTSESPLLYVFGSRGLLFATDLNIAQGV